LAVRYLAPFELGHERVAVAVGELAVDVDVTDTVEALLEILKLVDMGATEEDEEVVEELLDDRTAPQTSLLELPTVRILCM